MTIKALQKVREELEGARTSGSVVLTPPLHTNPAANPTLAVTNRPQQRSVLESGSKILINLEYRRG